MICFVSGEIAEKQNKRGYQIKEYVLSNGRKLCIEVKSTWTLQKHYDKVFAKQQGYRYYCFRC
jgi:hypothetical protein